MQSKQFASIRNATFNLALVVALLGYASFAIAQNPGTFTLTGKMTTPRCFHTATALADGRILIAGGFVGAYSPYGWGSTATATAELYDPVSGTFTATGNMTLPRANHTATLLADGRVLIEGGSTDSPASAELYDPSTGTFTAAGSIHTSLPARVDIDGAVLLADSRVLIVRGPTTADLYNPGMGTFTAAGNLAEPLGFYHTPILLQDSRVLLAGYGNSQLYDPLTGTFNPTGNPELFTDRTALLTNGTVLIAGGNNDPGPDAGAEVYDPSTGIFTAAGNMIAPRGNHTVNVLPDGKVLIAGGNSINCYGNSCAYSCCLSSAELYDSSAGLFTGTGTMSEGRAGHTATLLTSGNVLIAGGTAGGASAELYCPVNVTCPPDSWQLSLTNMKTSAGADSLNFWQWAWFWQNTPAFDGAPAGFGVAGSISPDLMAKITAAGGGNPLLNVSAEQWVLFYREVVP